MIHYKDNNSITINIGKQTLEFYSPQKSKSYSISTSKRGAGQEKDSGKTPLGRHYVFRKIGYKRPINSVFIGREFTFQIYSSALGDNQTDWILTRILWLAGCEEGFNCGGDVDTKTRFIYIHGTPYEDQLGHPASAGCIRMSNQDVIELFYNTEIKTLVNIIP